MRTPNEVNIFQRLVEQKDLTQSEARAIQNYLNPPEEANKWSIAGVKMNLESELSKEVQSLNAPIEYLKRLSYSLISEGETWAAYSGRIGADLELMKMLAERNVSLLYHSDSVTLDGYSPLFSFMQSASEWNESKVDEALPLFKTIIAKAPPNIFFSGAGSSVGTPLAFLGRTDFTPAFAKKMFPVILRAFNNSKIKSKQEQLEALYSEIIHSHILKAVSKAAAIKTLIQLIPAKKLTLKDSFEHCVTNRDYLTAMVLFDKGAQISDTSAQSINDAIEVYKIQDPDNKLNAARELRQKMVEKKPQIKDAFLADIQSNLENKSRTEILELFKEIKDPQGKYEILHIQRHATFDKFRAKMGFFVKNQPKEELPMHTQSYQKAVKMLKDAYLKAPRDNSQSNSTEEKEFLDYVRGNTIFAKGETSSSKQERTQSKLRNN